MAEFQEVMRQWGRMCGTNRYCDSCPIQKEDLPYTLCSEGGIRSVENLADAEFAIMSWAAENPEPVYPTWGDYISKLVIHDMCDGKISGPETVLTYAMNTPIPADMAEKLGIEPKEG